MRRTDGQIQESAINLEGLSDSELRELNDDPSVHELVKDMSATLRVARSYRKAGLIDMAMRHERRFDHMYSQLPERLRW